VANVPPSVTGAGFISPVNENSVGSVTGTISDPGILDTFSVVVDWADGSVPQTFTNLPSGAFTFTHQYLDNIPKGMVSNFTASLKVTDDDGGTVTVSAVETVNNLPPGDYWPGLCRHDDQ